MNNSNNAFHIWALASVLGIHGNGNKLNVIHE